MARCTCLLTDAQAKRRKMNHCKSQLFTSELAEIEAERDRLYNVMYMTSLYSMLKFQSLI